MKKLILVAVAALLLGVQANAQLVAKAGFVGGIDTQRYFGNTNFEGVGLNGFAFGADYKIALPWVKGLGAEPGVYFNFLFGRRDELNYSDIALSLPIHASYTFDINDTVSLLGLTGPTIQIGLAKNYRYANNNPVNLYDPNGLTYNRFMLLYDVAVGVELFSKIQITTGVDFGLTSFVRTNDMLCRRPVQYKLMVGYMF